MRESRIQSSTLIRRCIRSFSEKRPFSIIQQNDRKKNCFFISSVSFINLLEHLYFIQKKAKIHFRLKSSASISGANHFPKNEPADIRFCNSFPSCSAAELAERLSLSGTMFMQREQRNVINTVCFDLRPNCGTLRTCHLRFFFLERQNYSGLAFLKKNSIFN